MKDKVAKKAYSRVKVPAILQMEAVECGAASLTMILAYHKKYIPLAEIRAACGVSRDGSRASNIVDAAEKYQLSGDGFQKDPDELRYMQPPMILHWNFNHFVVLEGFKGNKVYLADPAEGKRVITFKELNDSFTGIVLTFEKKKEFKESGKIKTVMDSLRKRFDGIKTDIFYLVLIGLAMIVPGLVIPTLSRVFIDNVIIAKMNVAQPILLAMLGMGLLNMYIAKLQSSYLGKLHQKLTVASSSKFFWHVLKLPMNFFYQRFTGEIVDRININSDVASAISGEIAITAVNIFVIFFYFFLMLQYSIALTLIGVIAGILNLIVTRYISDNIINENKKVSQESGKLYSVSISGVQLIESIKAGGGESGFFSKWSGYHAKLIDSSQALGAYSTYISIIPSFIAAMTSIGILSLGAYQVLQGKLTIGMLIAFQGLMGQFMGPVSSVVSFATRWKSLKGNLDRLDDVEENPIDPMFSIDENEKSTLSKLEGYIELKNITFGYSPLDPPLISDFSLKLKPGARVAFVGFSGSGKSTITKVISGLYKEWSGEVFFDGINRKELPKSLINNSLSVIDQDIIPFEGSVRDNIKLWDDTISDADMIRAAIDSDIHDAIVARKEGYDYPLREDGSGFSGGQLQRIEIARALSNNPSIILMDEATAALDTKTEKYIDDSVRRRGCTSIIVAHRLSTIRDADEIIVLNRGKVEQRGTHEELKRDSKGLYSELIASA